jgi:hypothetical protein
MHFAQCSPTDRLSPTTLLKVYGARKRACSLQRFLVGCGWPQTIDALGHAFATGRQFDRNTGHAVRITDLRSCRSDPVGSQSGFAVTILAWVLGSCPVAEVCDGEGTTWAWCWRGLGWELTALQHLLLDDMSHGDWAAPVSTWRCMVSLMVSRGIHQTNLHSISLIGLKQKPACSIM